MRFVLIILIFFVLGGLLIISNNKLAMYGSENFSNFSELYGDWMGKVYSNMRVLTGNSIKLDWWPSGSNLSLYVNKP